MRPPNPHVIAVKVRIKKTLAKCIKASAKKRGASFNAEVGHRIELSYLLEKLNTARAPVLDHYLPKTTEDN